MMNPRLTLLGLLGLATAGACGPETNDDAGDSGPSTTAATAATVATETTETETTATGTAMPTTDPDGSTTSTPVDCNTLDIEDDCSLHPECVTVAGTEALPTATPGEYECSDARGPFGCAPAGCEVLVNAIVCRADDPSKAMWILDACVPGGWVECEGATCV
ncbi:MAG: hypothetical protein KDK70_09450 [Myxococcales bacterium]|nr:hypothetical protein [Myxococcales bacterium]